jgi:7-cyano-7-deazaguanine reductase
MAVMVLSAVILGPLLHNRFAGAKTDACLSFGYGRAPSLETCMAKKTPANSLQLGRPAPIPASPDKAQLDRVPNPHPDTDYVARFTMPEFTCLCPITGQPDFAHLVLDYVPDRFLIESKSLKLYFNSFRNYGAFHEDCTVRIGKTLVALLKPRWLRIGGYWYPRGGMPIDVFWQNGKLPAGVWVPDQGVAPYRGRG